MEISEWSEIITNTILSSKHMILVYYMTILKWTYTKSIFRTFFFFIYVKKKNRRLEQKWSFYYWLPISNNKMWHLHPIFCHSRWDGSNEWSHIYFQWRRWLTHCSRNTTPGVSKFENISFLFSLFFVESICCDHSFEPSRWHGSNGGHNIYFEWKIRKNI